MFFHKQRLKVLSSAKELLDGDEELGSWDPGILGWEMNHSIYEDLRITGKKYDKP